MLLRFKIGAVLFFKAPFRRAGQRNARCFFYAQSSFAPLCGVGKVGNETANAAPFRDLDQLDPLAFAQVPAVPLPGGVIAGAIQAESRRCGNSVNAQYVLAGEKFLNPKRIALL